MRFYLGLICILLGLGVSSLYAAPQSLGQVAHNMLDPLGVVTQVMYNICYILGGALIVGGAVQYKAHRDNPLQVPISRPLFLLFVGLILVALPFITRFSESAATVAVGS